MSGKNVIQKLQDCQLIRLFLQFVEYFHLEYDKTCKQISYKCYQATWSLENIKATGYGRTQSEAFKHSLRNLLELLIQQPFYTEFFVETLNSPNFKSQINDSYNHGYNNMNNNINNNTTNTNNQINSNNSTHNNTSKTLIKKQPVPNNQYSSSSGPGYVKKAINIKTQGHQSLQKQQYSNSQMKVLNSIHKINSIKNDQNTSINKQKYYYENNKAKQTILKQSQKFNNISNMSTITQQIKLNKNDSLNNFKANNNLNNPNNNHNNNNNNHNHNPNNNHNTNNSYKSFQKENIKRENEKKQQFSQSEQLRKALKKLSQLQNYLNQINQQNQNLRNKLNKMNQQQGVEHKDKQNLGYDNQPTHKHMFRLSDVELQNLKNKPNVPKLKLDILPNYHKKAQKSLNQSLLAAYNQKRSTSVKKIIC